MNIQNGFPSTHTVLSSSTSGNTETNTINNAYVTELSDQHQPDENQTKYFSEQLNKMKDTNNISELNTLKEEVKQALHELKRDIYDTRDMTFVLRNDGTDSVYGELRSTKTTDDRDNYIKKLVNYHSVILDLSRLSDTKTPSDSKESYSEAADKADKYLDSNRAFRLHHSSSLYGDMQALDMIMAGQPVRLPALTYNRGSCQFG